MKTAGSSNPTVWLTDPSSVVLHKESPVTARDWLRQMIALHFGELKQKATTIFEEVCSDRLEIEQTTRKSRLAGQ